MHTGLHFAFAYRGEDAGGEDVDKAICRPTVSRMPQRTGVHDVQTIAVIGHRLVGVTEKAYIRLPFPGGTFQQGKAGFYPVHMTVGEEYFPSAGGDHITAAQSGWCKKVAVSGNAHQIFAGKLIPYPFNVVVAVAQMNHDFSRGLRLYHIIKCSPSSMGIGDHEYPHKL